MTTAAMTLSEYADLVSNIADAWDGDEPVILIGDRHGNVDVRADDGHTMHGSVAFAQELFDGNGVLELGQKSDTRFYGTMLLDASDLDDDAAEQILDVDYKTEVEA